MGNITGPPLLRPPEPAPATKLPLPMVLTINNHPARPEIFHAPEWRLCLWSRTSVMTGSINAAQWPRGHLELMQTLPSSAIPAYFVKRLHLRHGQSLHHRVKSICCYWRSVGDWICPLNLPSQGKLPGFWHSMVDWRYEHRLWPRWHLIAPRLARF